MYWRAHDIIGKRMANMAVNSDLTRYGLVAQLWATRWTRVCSWGEYVV